MKPYYVINWDFNKDKMAPYDIMPYLYREYLEDKDKFVFMKGHKIPETFEEYKEFILSASRYQFWARCEYEVIVTGWPQQKNELKLDIYRQIEMNIDVITNHFMGELNLLNNAK